MNKETTKYEKEYIDKLLKKNTLNKRVSITLIVLLFMLLIEMIISFIVIWFIDCTSIVSGIVLGILLVTMTLVIIITEIKAESELTVEEQDILLLLLWINLVKEKHHYDK